MRPISADYPLGGIPLEDIAATPGNEAYRALYEDWVARGRHGEPPLSPPTMYEDWKRALDYAIARRRAQPPAPPLFFGGDPRNPHFLQLQSNPDPVRYYRIVENDDEAATALAHGELPIIVSHALLNRLAPLDARDLVEQARLRQYELPHAPFRNAVELLRSGRPSRGAEDKAAPTVAPRYNTESRYGQSLFSEQDNDALIEALLRDPSFLKDLFRPVVPDTSPDPRDTSRRRPRPSSANPALWSIADNAPLTSPPSTLPPSTLPDRSIIPGAVAWLMAGADVDRARRPGLQGGSGVHGDPAAAVRALQWFRSRGVPDHDLPDAGNPRVPGTLDDPRIPRRQLLPSPNPKPGNLVPLLQAWPAPEDTTAERTAGLIPLDQAWPRILAGEFG